MSELERALLAVGADLEIPEAPDLVPVVRARLERRGRSRPSRRWVLAVAVAVALAVFAATLAIPDARSALFRALHIGGTRIEIVDELPRVAAQPDLEVTLGSRISLDEARRDPKLDLRELEADPDRVYVGFDGTVWFLFGTPERPRLLLAQTPLHGVDQDLLVKKVAGPETRVERVSVDGRPGVYLSGEPHFLFLLDEFGAPVEDSARLARDVLLWEDGGTAYRLEGDFDRDTALELARSLR